MSTPELRKLWTQYFRESDLMFEEWKGRGYNGQLNTPPFPEESRGLTCGAMTRTGTPCKQKAIYINAQCKCHGGLITGPRTKRGKRRSSLNWKKRKIFVAG